MLARDLVTRFRLLALLALALSAVGCAQPMFARAPVLYPAALPIRAFPSIVIAGGQLPEGDLGLRLEQHLKAGGHHEVRRVDVKELEPLRQAGGISEFSLVVLLEPGLYSDENDGWQTMPVSQCDFFFGCYTQYQNVYSAMPLLGAELKLTVYEGPTARVLQTTTLDVSIEADDSVAARKLVVEKLGLKLVRAVDVLKSETRVQLEPVDKHPIVREALARIQKGEWAEGRALLEQAAQSLGGLKHKVQARIWYDLAIARWHAPGADGLTQPAFEAAQRALVLAIQLEGSTRYQRALEALKQARQRAEVLEEQRRAARYNYGLHAQQAEPATAPLNP